MVEPRDVELDFDRSRWKVAEDGRGGFTVTARVPNATGQLRATVRGVSAVSGSAGAAGPAGPVGAAGAAPASAAPGTSGAAVSPGPALVALGVGLSDLPLADLEDAARWTGTGAAPGAGRPGRGLALAPPAGGGTAAATPPRPLRIPELARSLTLWVNGDGSGARPAVELADGDGAAAVLRGPAVDWTGWRQITLPLPAMAERPFTVTRLSATTPAATRTGTPARANTPAPAKAPALAPAPAKVPALPPVTAGPPVTAAPRLLLDTLAARTPPTGVVRTAGAPDPIVTTAARVDARPWRFAIASAAVRPPAGSARTQAVDFALTGTGRPAFVHRGVRFLPLSSTRPTLAGGGLERITALRAAVAEAAREPGTGALAVVEPYAPRAVDRKEAVLRLRLLAEFRRATGKRAVVITIGAPRFAAGRTEGVLTVAAPRTGRTVIGADAFAAGDWLSVLPAGGR